MIKLSKFTFCNRNKADELLKSPDGYDVSDVRTIALEIVDEFDKLLTAVFHVLFLFIKFVKLNFDVIPRLMSIVNMSLI